MEYCHARNYYRFHRDGLGYFLAEGGKMDVAVHTGYAEMINSVENYYRASKDMLDSAKRHESRDLDDTLERAAQSRDRPANASAPLTRAM